MSAAARKPKAEQPKLIDFRELHDTALGEELEALTEHVLRALGYETSRSGRGPDGGKDLIFSEPLKSDFVTQNRRWLVQCKHNAVSGRAVNEADIGPIVEKCKKHDASGYLLVTTTTATDGVVKLFEKLTADREYHLVAGIWDEHRLREVLSREQLREVLKRFLPEGYARLQALEPEAVILERLKDKGLSEDELTRVSDVVSAALDAAARRRDLAAQNLTSTHIYPAATSFRAEIDEATTHFLERRLADCVAVLDQLPFEEWTASIDAYVRHNRGDAEQLLRESARLGLEEDVRLAAARRLVDEWRYTLAGVLPYLHALGRESMAILALDLTLDAPVALAIEGRVYDSDPDDLDELPPHRVSDVSTERIEFSLDEEAERLVGEVELSVEVVIGEEDGDSGLSMYFPGHATVTVRGDDRHDVDVEEISVDIQSFYADE